MCGVVWCAVMWCVVAVVLVAVGAAVLKLLLLQTLLFFSFCFVCLSVLVSCTLASSIADVMFVLICLLQFRAYCKSLFLITVACGTVKYTMLLLLLQ